MQCAQHEYLRYLLSHPELIRDFPVSIFISRPILSFVILAKICVVVICLWPSIFDTVSIDTPCERQTEVAKVCRLV